MRMRVILPVCIVMLGCLNGCAMLVGGIVGAAVTPLITPQADRALAALGLDWIDPDGTDKVKTYDKTGKVSP